MPTLCSSSESQYQRQLYTLPPTRNEKGVDTKTTLKKQKYSQQTPLHQKQKYSNSGNQRGHRHGGLLGDRYSDHAQRSSHLLVSGLVMFK